MLSLEVLGKNLSRLVSSRGSCPPSAVLGLQLRHPILCPHLRMAVFSLCVFSCYKNTHHWI